MINKGEGCAHAHVGQGVCWLSDVTQVATQLPVHVSQAPRPCVYILSLVQVLEDLIIIINNVIITNYNLCISNNLYTILLFSQHM